MESEYQVLSHLQENEITTQRTISKKTGLSLGAVNLLLKKMARKGLVKIERLNARTVRYILTPKGLNEKSRLTYRYIRDSYKQIFKIKDLLNQLLAEQASDLKDRKVILCGPADEIREIITQHLNQEGISFELCSDPGRLKESTGENRLLLIWGEEEEAAAEGLEAVNIMSLL
jgi:DNA-binding MarR family transcriptional regulator